MTTIDRKGNITHTKGDTFALTLFDVKLDDVLIIFAGWKAKLVVRTTPDAVTEILALTETAGIDLSTKGQVAIMADAAAIMKDIPARNYYVYDLEITDDEGNVDTWFSNKRFTITEEVAW